MKYKFTAVKAISLGVWPIYNYFICKLSTIDECLESKILHVVYM